MGLTVYSSFLNANSICSFARLSDLLGIAQNVISEAFWNICWTLNKGIIREETEIAENVALDSWFTTSHPKFDMAESAYQGEENREEAALDEFNDMIKNRSGKCVIVIN